VGSTPNTAAGCCDELPSGLRRTASSAGWLATLATPGTAASVRTSGWVRLGRLSETVTSCCQ